MKDGDSDILGAGNRPDPDNRPSAKLGRTLTSRERAFLDALSSRGQQLANMYLASLTALDTIPGHERFVLAALEMREIMHLIPPTYGVPKRNEGISAFDLQALQARWSNVEAQKHNGTWTGNVNGPIKGFLEEFDKQWRRRDQEHSTRKSRMRDFLNLMDESAGRTPAEFSKSLWDEWRRLLRFFNGLAHHDDTMHDEEFKENRSQLEVLLLNRLRPRPYADYEALDALIEEGENA